MLFSKKRKIPSLTLKLGNFLLVFVYLFKYLEVTFDKPLSCKYHVDINAEECSARENLLCLLSGTSRRVQGPGLEMCNFRALVSLRWLSAILNGLYNMVKSHKRYSSDSVHPVKCLTQETDLDKSSYKRYHSDVLSDPRVMRLISTFVRGIK